MKLLITGFGGFVSEHFLTLLNDKEPGSEVLGIDKNDPGIDPSRFGGLSISFKQIDLLDRSATAKIIAEFQPEFILHLASISSVAKSWESPLDSFLNNTSIFLNIAEHLRTSKSNCRILSIGSSEEFGEVNEKDLPLTEEHPLNPASPYAVARVSQEMLSKVYADGFGLDIVMTRSFNHIGPGQKENFVVASFAKQLVELAAQKNKDNTITTGDISVTRDFLDVRDVVKAYYHLLKKGRTGEVYNICSGIGIQLSGIIEKMAGILGMEIKTLTDERLLRPNENRKIIGSHEKISKELGWKPDIPLEKSLEDILDYWRSRL
ncbi:MAG: GDP-mannose 4,6-dehydratase [Chitinophagaceae bacterium]